MAYVTTEWQSSISKECHEMLNITLLDYGKDSSWPLIQLRLMGMSFSQAFSYKALGKLNIWSHMWAGFFYLTTDRYCRPCAARLKITVRIVNFHNHKWLWKVKKSLPPEVCDTSGHSLQMPQRVLAYLKAWMRVIQTTSHVMWLATREKKTMLTKHNRICWILTNVQEP